MTRCTYRHVSFYVNYREILVPQPQPFTLNRAYSLPLIHKIYLSYVQVCCEVESSRCNLDSLTVWSTPLGHDIQPRGSSPNLRSMGLHTMGRVEKQQRAIIQSSRYILFFCRRRHIAHLPQLSSQSDTSGQCLKRTSGYLDRRPTFVGHARRSFLCFFLIFSFFEFSLMGARKSGGSTNAKSDGCHEEGSRANQMPAGMLVLTARYE